MASKKKDWEPIQGNKQSVPFPAKVLNCLPDTIRKFIIALAVAIQCDIGLAVGAFLAALSSCAVGRVIVQPMPKHKPNYREATQLYMILSAESGERKSTAIEICVKPLHEYIGDQETAYGFIDHILEAQQAAFHANAVQSIMQSSKAPDTAINDMYKDSKALHNQYHPRSKEEILSDVTPEGLTQSLARSQGRVSIISGEPDILSVMSGDLYSRNGSVNLTVFMDGYDNRSASITRSKRIIHIPTMSLSIVIGAQPKELNKFMSKNKGRGIHERCIYFIATMMAGVRKPYTEDIPEEIYEQYCNRIKAIIDDLHELQHPITLHFSPEAEAAYESFYLKIESRRTLGADLRDDKIVGWSERIKANTVRIAALLSLFLEEDEVSIACWNAAEHLTLDYLIPCAKAVFDLSYISLNAQAIAAHLVGKSSIEQADLYRMVRNLKAFKNNKATFNRAINELKDCGLIKVQANKSNGPGRNPSPTIYIHPEIDQVL